MNIDTLGALWGMADSVLRAGDGSNPSLEAYFKVIDNIIEHFNIDSPLAFPLMAGAMGCGLGNMRRRPGISIEDFMKTFKEDEGKEGQKDITEEAELLGILEKTTELYKKIINKE